MKFDRSWVFFIASMLFAHSADPLSATNTRPSALISSSALASCTQQQVNASRWLFVRGLHHGGTTLAAALLALHPNVSALKIGKYEDEASSHIF